MKNHPLQARKTYHLCIVKFSLIFQEYIQTTNENVFFSSLSILNVLALLSQAANGDTYEQMKQSLYLNENKTLTANQFDKYNELLQDRNENTTLLISNQIYVNAGYALNKTFQATATKFSCGIESLNFGNNTQAAQTINDFIAGKTHNKIKNLIQPQNIDNEITVMLINAIHFKGNWMYKFNKTLTTVGDFYINENETVQVDFMTIKSNFVYDEIYDLNATALELKYANSKYSFIILLPWSRTGLYALEKKLKSFDLRKITEWIFKKDYGLGVDVKIPKFKVEHKIKLNDILKNVCIDLELFF